MVQIRGKEANAMNTSECKKVVLNFNTSDWFKHQILRNPRKAAFYLVNCLFVSLCILCVKMKTFLIDESILRHNKLLSILPGSLLKAITRMCNCLVNVA